MQQVILNMIVTKYLYNKIFNYMDPWGKTLEYIVWSIMASYHFTIHYKLVQYVFGRDMIFNLTPVVDL